MDIFLSLMSQVLKHFWMSVKLDLDVGQSHETKAKGKAINENTRVLETGPFFNGSIQ